MPTIYRIHPGIGIARLGNSPDAFCISPEQPAVLPLDCDPRGNPLMSPDGTQEMRIWSFKDAEGRMKRQAARFQIWAYDEKSPQGRPLKLGDPIEGGGNAGTLVNIQWRVYLANKKSSWYEFHQLQGEHGYDPNHPRRNAAITDPNAR
ncbi:MAG TPA: LodA/GoxA family CTQ-dependent oxidase, partial [Pyrinomonadaceae bacterium]